MIDKATANAPDHKKLKDRNYAATLSLNEDLKGMGLPFIDAAGVEEGSVLRMRKKSKKKPKQVFAHTNVRESQDSLYEVRTFSA